MENYSVAKKNENLPFPIWTMLSEISLRKANTIYHLYVESKEDNQEISLKS